LDPRGQVGVVWRVFRLQTQLIFSQRIVWFLGAIVLYIGVLYAINTFVAEDPMDMDDMYIMVLTLPVAALSLYLNMQTIVNEKEQRTLEVMFTTAGSRYKVWLLRLGALNALLALIGLGISALVFFTFMDFSIPGMAGSIFATAFLIGNVTLYFAVRMRSGLGAGMVTALTVFLHVVTSGMLELGVTRYFLFFNPFSPPNQTDPTTWDLWAWQNRIGVLLAGVVLLFFAIRGMDRRDRLLR